jgi:hypothetical protein
MPTYKLILKGSDSSATIRRFKHQELRALDYDSLECLLDDLRDGYWKLIGRTDLTPPTDWQIFRTRTRPALREFRQSVMDTIGLLTGFLIRIFAFVLAGVIVAGVLVGLAAGVVALENWWEARHTPVPIASYEETPFCTVEQ